MWCRDMSRTARRNDFKRGIRSFVVPRSAPPSISLSLMSIARKREYHESQRLSISRATKLLYITTATPSISLRVSGQKGEFMPKTSHELAIEFAVEITELCSRIKGRPEYTKHSNVNNKCKAKNFRQHPQRRSNAFTPNIRN